MFNGMYHHVEHKYVNVVVRIFGSPYNVLKCLKKQLLEYYLFRYNKWIWWMQIQKDVLVITSPEDPTLCYEV